jgi:hypothetical protein
VAFPHFPPPGRYQSTKLPRKHRPFGVCKDRQFGVCALAHPDDTIRSSSSREPPEPSLPSPLQRAPAFLLCTGSSLGGTKETLTRWRYWITTAREGDEGERGENLSTGTPGRASSRRVPRTDGHNGLQTRPGHKRSRPRVYDIVREKRGISADTALRLSRYFGMSEGFWINAQSHYDLEVAKDSGGERIEKEVRPLATTR